MSETEGGGETGTASRHRRPSPGLWLHASVASPVVTPWRSGDERATYGKSNVGIIRRHRRR